MLLNDLIYVINHYKDYDVLETSTNYDLNCNEEQEEHRNDEISSYIEDNELDRLIFCYFVKTGEFLTIYGISEVYDRLAIKDGIELNMLACPISGLWLLKAYYNDNIEDVLIIR